MKTLDRIFGCLMILGTCGHTIGTFVLLPSMSPLWVWSLSGSLAGFILGTLNLIRAGRVPDRTIAALTTFGNAAWVFIALAFNASNGNMRDPRGLIHATVAFVLMFFSICTWMRGSESAVTNAGSSWRAEAQL